MFEKVDIKEIKAIKERLEIELEDKNLPFQRREEVESLLYHIDSWLDFREHQEREHYRKAIKLVSLYCQEATNYYKHRSET